MAPDVAIREQFMLLTRDSGELLRMYRDGERESASLDFKAVHEKKIDLDEMAKDLSAMANSDGGFILFGVSQKRTDPTTPGSGTPPDSFAGFHMQLAPAEVEAAIRSVARTKITPPINVLTQDVPVTLDGDQHFVVVCGVLPADEGPCRPARAENYFWRRSGDRNRAMEYFEIADMFGRRARPALTVWAGLKLTGQVPEGHTGRLRLYLHNAGKGTAEKCLVRMTANSWDFGSLPGSTLDNWPFEIRKSLSPKSVVEWVSRLTTVIYPDDDVIVHEQPFSALQWLKRVDLDFVLACPGVASRRYRLLLPDGWTESVDPVLNIDQRVGKAERLG